MAEEKSYKIENDNFFGKDIKAAPIPEKKIGIDLSDSFFENIIEAGLANSIDLTSINSFSQTAQSREQVYQMLDTMCQDSMIAAVLETYAEDATEPNDYGQIVWCESDDADVSGMVNFLLDSMKVDKNVYSWVYDLCKYGDLYLRLYRQSELKDELFDSAEMDKLDEISARKANVLNEDINIKAFSKEDSYAHYMEKVKNPAELFELTRFGKTYGYIKADVKMQGSPTQNQAMNYYKYSFKNNDIDIYSATDYVHGCLMDTSNRVSETVSIFLGEDETENKALSYTVKKGQSILYNIFKVWRQLSLLENSVLLNRITKSSIVRAIGIEVGDMPKEQVGPLLQKVKSLFEQKSALNTGDSYSEYTNPGPIENNVYLPIRNNQGSVSIQTIGGDVDVKGLADLDYFKDRMFGALRVPKQYFGSTEDGAGFNGGQSLSIISSRYAKMIKRIQNTVIQTITDAINLQLLDKGLSSYINKFTIRMQAPTTQEELDRRDNMSNKIGIVSDMMNIFGDIDDPVAKLKILKNLVSNVVTDDEIIQLLQEEIDRLEAEGIDTSNESSDTEGSFDDLGGGSSEFDDSEPLDLDGTDDEIPTDMDLEDTTDELPTPDDLGMDMTNNDQDFEA